MTCFLAALLGLAGVDRISAATVATGWRVGDHGAQTRFVLDLGDSVAFKIQAETGPDRLRIDLPDTEWKFREPGGARPDGLVRAAEFSDPPAPPHITLWLKGPAKVVGAHLVPPSEGFRYRLVIDLQAEDQAQSQAAAVAPPPPPPPKAAPKPIAQAALPPPPPAPKPQPKPEPQPIKREPVPAAPPPPPVAKAPPAMAPISLPPPEPAPPTAPAKPEPAETAAATAPAAAPAPASPGPPLALKPAFTAIEKPAVAPAPPPPPAPPPIVPHAQTAAAAVMPPHLVLPPGEAAPPPASAPLPRIVSAPLATTPVPDQPAIVPATAQIALPAVRVIREPGRPVMVVLPLPPPQPTPPPPPADTRPVIVIDPGHGGIDPGATGLSGVHEKAITLALAQELQRRLEDTGHYRVLLTRSDDSAVPLRERVRIARAAHADLFLSIHADALANHAISGLSVYTESETASDRETEALAAKENKADLIAGMDLSSAAPVVTNILLDLAQRETRNRSGVFAGDLVEELGGVTRLLPRSHRSAGFAVLTAPDIPSVLLELGYLSNKADERGLTAPDQRGRLATAILRAIDRFFAAEGELRRS